LTRIAMRLIVALVGLALVGCATTQVALHSIGSRPPLCRTQTTPEPALVLWGTAWRDNQKDVGLREEMVARAISRFFGTTSCYSNVEVLRSAGGRSAIELSDSEALILAVSSSSRYKRVILVRVEELGPLVIIHPSPILWEGGTEVVLRVRVLNVTTSALEADITSHWKNGGAFILKGTKTLEHDLQAALASVFLHSPGAEN